jgi:hypothetical protein
MPEEPHVRKPILLAVPRFPEKEIGFGFLVDE